MSRGADGLGARLLVSVDTCGVDMAVPGLESMENDGLGGSSRPDKAENGVSRRVRC